MQSMSSNQSLLNIELTRYFNSIIETVINPGRLHLQPNEKPFKSIESLHYNKSTETLYIEMADMMYVINLANNGENLEAYAYKKIGVETQ